MPGTRKHRRHRHHRKHYGGRSFKTALKKYGPYIAAAYGLLGASALAWHEYNNRKPMQEEYIQFTEFPNGDREIKHYKTPSANKKK